MHVALQGSSASAVTAGLLLLTHAKRLGTPLKVAVVGDRDDLARVAGPALVLSPVLAGCGVGRVAARSSLVMMPGPSLEPLAVSLERGGLHGWFTVDRRGVGEHAGTRAFVALCRNSDIEAQNLGRILRRGLATVGCTPEPALLDLLFGAPCDPLDRLAIALRAGRAMTGSVGRPFTSFIHSGIEDLPDPLQSPVDMEVMKEARANGDMERLLGRLTDGVRASVQDWMDGVGHVSKGDLDHLLCGLAELGSHLVSLPMAGMLPQLTPARESIALNLGEAIGSVSGTQCANQAMADMFEYLGGEFVEVSQYALTVPSEAPPTERLARWEWFCRAAHSAQEEADRLWRRIIDPVQ
ncbi:MAG: hypothetical protein CL930_06285 [Deltaproteobacteria bacterium]|nr:hypothetical protein [Deltaproteobacteria bacterium]